MADIAHPHAAVLRWIRLRSNRHYELAGEAGPSYPAGQTWALRAREGEEIADEEPDWPRPFVYVADPPYGIAYKSNYLHNYRMLSNAERTSPRAIVGDEDTAERDAIMEVDGWENAAVFGPSPLKLLTVPPWGKPKAVLVLDKGDGVGMGDTGFPWRPNIETVAVYGRGWRGKRSSSVLRGFVMNFARSETCTHGRQHPHEKPLETVVELVAKAPPWTSHCGADHGERYHGGRVRAPWAGVLGR